MVPNDERSDVSDKIVQEPRSIAEESLSVVGDDPGQRPDAVSAGIADQVAGLVELEGRPLAEHAEAYQRVHAELQAALAEIDSA